ncbi:Crp/Fnr family transcriptional regulator [Caulobacter hibisci]|uniref:Crp/Fnr family transcriptional regulator n=1 Tax=Caulobacter hibisci TaxID=2035993 RepID=A0ABS0T2P5_9CAUL|nr:Crp/Fnr family transcriptional regulator [Caulobacter hibisci]MBI1686156.1 Crp/Fnr family transcriptional regulator [Caulobacter hibisci]
MADSAELTDRDPRAERVHHAYAGNRLLLAMPEEARAALKPAMSLTALSRGTVLFDVGEDVRSTYLPCRPTMVSLLVVTPDGREVEAATVGWEGALGGVVSGGLKPAYGRAVVQAPGPAFVVPTARLDEMRQRFPALGDLFTRYADSMIAQMMQSVACNALHTIEQRCCRWLLAAHDRAGEDIVRLTQEALADMMGVQRTTVTAAAKVLQADGIIQTRRGRVEILDRRKLERRACECHGQVEAHFRKLLPEVAASAG